MTTNGTNPPNGNLGLKGPWAQLANMTAVLLICLLFYQDRHAALDQAKEDRQLFKESLQTLREDSHRQWEAIRRLTAAVKALIEDKKGDKP